MLTVDIKIALKSLRATKVRTVLTMLGIVIGVASVTVVMSLGEGAKQQVRNQLGQLGNNLLTIRPGKASRDANGNITDYDFLAALGASTISERDLATVRKNPAIKNAAPIMAVTGSVGSSAEQPSAKNTPIIATSVDADTVLNLKVHHGQFLDTNISRDTVVLGQDLATELLGSDTAIGHKVFIRGQEFTVIGILDQYNAPVNISNVFDFNRAAFITLDAGKAFNQGIAQIQQISARVADQQDTKQVSQQLQQQILSNHGGQEDFTVLRPQETLQITDNFFRIITSFTSAIASISLIVGGIGIMNIMLVAVTERTREIGIRKAVGATNSQIMRQFLIEALVMSVVGGLVGVVLAYVVAFIIGTFLAFMPVITLDILLIAFGVSTVVGVLFGVAPAFKAARKDPIEALRFFQ